MFKIQRAMNRLIKEGLTHINMFKVERGYCEKKDARRSEYAPLMVPAPRQDASADSFLNSCRVIGLKDGAEHSPS